MSKDATITTRVDQSLKDSATELFNSMGISMTTAIQLFLQDAVQHQRLRFDVNLDREGSKQ